MDRTPNVKLAVPLFAVTNMESSLRLYIDGLGFSMQERWIDEGKLRWCWLTLDKVAVMLQEIKTEGHDAWGPTGKLGEGVNMCFICEDAIALYHEFISRGVAVTKPFVGNGMWVITCIDPDGYRLEFESKTDVPEGTEYTG